MAKKSKTQCLDDENAALREKVMRSFQAKMDRIIEKYSNQSTDDYETVLFDIDTGKYVYENGDSIEVECSSGTTKTSRSILSRNSDSAVFDEALDFLDTPDHEIDEKRVSACDSFAKAFFIATSPLKNMEKETRPKDFQKLIEPPTKKHCRRQINMNPETDLKHYMDCHVKISRLDDKNMKCTVPSGLAKEKMCQRISESPIKEERKKMEKDKAPVQRKGARHCPKDGLMEDKRAVNDKKNNNLLPEVQNNVSDDDKPSNSKPSVEEKTYDDLEEEEIVFLTCKSIPHMQVFPEWFIPRKH